MISGGEMNGMITVKKIHVSFLRYTVMTSNNYQ
jgi:hypothetical protein